jgi:hypothetical protein
VTITPTPAAQQEFGISQTVPKGRYADYQALMTEQAAHMGFEGPNKIPDAVQQDTRECMIKLMMANSTPAELTKLNSYARGEIPMSPQELSAMGDVIKDRAGPTDAALVTNMRSICPATVAALESSGNGSGFKLVYVP